METSINVNLNNENQKNKIHLEKPETNENLQLVSNNKNNNIFTQNENDIEYDNQITTNEEDQNYQRKGYLTSLKPYYCYKKLGKTFTFFGDKDGSPFIVIGPHWSMYVCFCSLMTA